MVFGSLGSLGAGSLGSLGPGLGSLGSGSLGSLGQGSGSLGSGSLGSLGKGSGSLGSGSLGSLGKGVGSLVKGSIGSLGKGLLGKGSLGSLGSLGKGSLGSLGSPGKGQEVSCSTMPHPVQSARNQSTTSQAGQRPRQPGQRSWEPGQGQPWQPGQRELGQRQPWQRAGGLVLHDAPSCPICQKSVNDFTSWAEKAESLGVQFERVIVTSDPIPAFPVQLLDCWELIGEFGIAINAQLHTDIVFHGKQKTTGLLGSYFEIVGDGITYRMNICEVGETMTQGSYKVKVNIDGELEEVIELEMDASGKPLRATSATWQGIPQNYKPAGQTERSVNLRAWRHTGGLEMILDDADPKFYPWHGNKEREDELKPEAGFPCNITPKIVAECLEGCLQCSLRPYALMHNNCHNFCANLLSQLKGKGAIDNWEFEDGRTDQYK